MSNTEEDRVTSREEEYQEIIKNSNRYLQEFQAKFTFSTSNSSE